VSATVPFSWPLATSRTLFWRCAGQDPPLSTANRTRNPTRALDTPDDPLAGGRCARTCSSPVHERWGFVAAGDQHDGVLAPRGTRAASVGREWYAESYAQPLDAPEPSA